MPDWRRKGIGRAMLHWMEEHLKEIAQKHPRTSEKCFQVNLGQSQAGAAILLERTGYQPVRHFYQLVRPTLDDLPDKIRQHRGGTVFIGGEDPTELVSLEEIEKRYIDHVLKAVNQNRTQAARVLGLDRKTLYRRSKREASA